MKNVQVIDSAANCTYSIFAFSDDEFGAVFPDPRQDIAFIEDVVERLGDAEVGRLLELVWRRPVEKPDVVGIHGTLFYELPFKMAFYPTRVDAEMLTGFEPVES